MAANFINGSDLIVSIGAKALAYSTGCKISTSAETGERLTKESPSAKWGEKYVKKLNETVSADGIGSSDGSANKPSYDQLKAMMIAGEPVTLTYSIRGTGREGDESAGYTGSYLITSIDLDAQAGDDSKYSATFESCGAVTKVGNGLTASASQSS